MCSDLTGLNTHPRNRPLFESMFENLAVLSKICVSESFVLIDCEEIFLVITSLRTDVIEAFLTFSRNCVRVRSSGRTLSKIESCKSG